MSKRLTWHSAVAGVLIFVTSEAVSQTAFDTRWNVREGLWSEDANWVFEDGSEAEPPSTDFDESAWIGNGGAATVDSSVPDVVKLLVPNGTVLIQQSGSLNAVNTNTEGVSGSSEIGRNGTLGLSGNGSLSTVDLESTGLIELNSADAKFNVTGDLNSRGTLALNITSAGTPKVTVGGAAALAGTIAANFDNSVNLAFGDSFEFLSGASSVANNGARVVVLESVVLDVGLDVQLANTNSTASLVVSNLPVLSVNRASGDAAIRNVVGGPVTMTGYAITSELGLLDPNGLAGLDAQGVEGWVAPNPLTTAISEVNLTGEHSLAVDESLSLGKAYNGGATHPLDEDVAFQFVTPDGSVLDGLVEYLGPANDLVLNVDPDTGEVTIQNLSAFIDPVDLTGYNILSSSGALKPENWNSFTDSGAAGSGWTEANPQSSTIAELNLFESKLFSNGTAISLGNIFDTSGARDLELQYTTADALLSATVEYGAALVPISWDCNGDGVIDVSDANCTAAADINAFLSDHGFISGDLDGNGSVDFPDFLVLSANFGSPGQYTDGDINKDDTVSFPDFLILSANFGQSAAAAAAVPEPGGLTILGLGGGLLLGLRRRRLLPAAVTPPATACAQGRFLAGRLASKGLSMKKSTFSLGALCLLAILVVPKSLHAQIDIIAGEIIPITGPGDLVTLNQPENLVYTINVWGEDDRVIRGVEFLSDNENVNPDGIPGYRHDWTHNVTNWETKPEFGDTVDDDEFEELMSDIRWTDNSPGNEFGVGSHLEVAANTEYTLQLLISGNHEENRIWDIFLDGKKVVDEFQSNNYEPYDQGVVWAYTHTFIAPDNELNITFRQGETGSDGNAILQGIILAIAGEGVTPGDFNNDDVIDLADFQILLTNFHSSGVSFADGDINFDRTVDIRDFAAFRGVFEAANAANAGIVPEPGTLLTFALGGAMLLGLLRNRRRLGYHKFLPVVMLAASLSVLPAARADLIGYWPFEDGDGDVAEDASGNENHGQLTETATFTDDGVFGSALNVGEFNDGAAVLLNDAANRENGAAGFDSIVDTQNATIQYWFHREGLAPQNQWEWFFGTGGNRQLSGAPWGDGNIYFDVAGCCGGNQRISTSITDAHTDGEWHHMAYRKHKPAGEDLAQTSVWLDGVKIVESDGFVIDDITPIDTASIGADTNGGSSVIGRIDEFAIWDEALDDAEIVALSEGAPVLPLPEPLGDFNGDSVVDTADFMIMAANFGEKFSRDDSITKGDFNGDTRVNLKDFLGFRMLFNSQQGATAATVPEPSSLTLLGIAGALMLARRRQRIRDQRSVVSQIGSNPV